MAALQPGGYLGAAGDQPGALADARLDVRAHTLLLVGPDHGADEGVRVHGVADGQRLDEVLQLGHGLVVAAAVHQDAGVGAAGLAVVGQGGDWPGDGS